MTDIAAVILAAGSSSRYGEPKQLLDWQGQPLVVHVARQALAAGLVPVVVVLAPDSRSIETIIRDHLPEPLIRGKLRIAVNWEASRPLSGSIRAGIASVPPSSAGVCLIQGDAPLVTTGFLQELRATHASSGRPLAYPTVRGGPRPPAVFSRELFPEIAALSDDEGGRVLIERYQSQAAEIELERPEIVADVDTPADYAALKRNMRAAHAGPAAASSHDRLGSIRNLIVDMDGVLWHSETPLPGLRPFFHFLRQNEIGFILATNNSSLMPQQYAAKLARFGVEVSPGKVVTSAQATAAYVARVCGPAAPVYVIGGDGIRHALQAEGMVLTADEAECVVVGWDRELTWQKLNTASLLIHQGARFVGTNPDKSYPTERGPAPGNGAQLAALEATTGVTPVIVGKPEPWLYGEAMRRMGASPAATAAVGDRIETDIVGAERAGLLTILLLSGIAGRDDVSSSPIRPDLVLADIRDLVAVWGGVLARAAQSA